MPRDTCQKTYDTFKGHMPKDQNNQLALGHTQDDSSWCRKDDK